MSSQEPWYRKTWLLLILLVLCAPLGILLLWLSDKLTKGTKVALTICSAWLFIAALRGSSEDEQQKLTPDPSTSAENRDKHLPSDPPGAEVAPEPQGNSHLEQVSADSDDMDPPPPVVHRKEQVPELLVQLEASSAFKQLQPAAVPDTKLFLTIVSNLLAEGGAPHALMQRARTQQLHEPAVTTYLIIARTGRLPEPVEQLARGFLNSLGDEAFRKTWNDQDGTDVTALAAWLHRKEPSYLRELIKTRREGPLQWVNYPADRKYEEPWIPWLALPGAAYQRLSQMVEITDAEWLDWCTWFGQEPIEKINPENMQVQRSCGCSEGRAVSWEELRSSWPLTIPGGCLRCEREIRAGRAIDMVVLQHANQRYAINGSAASERKNWPIEPIWAEDPEHEGLKIGTTVLISMGRDLCE